MKIKDDCLSISQEINLIYELSGLIDKLPPKKELDKLSEELVSRLEQINGLSISKEISRLNERFVLSVETNDIKVTEKDSILFTRAIRVFNLKYPKLQAFLNNN